MTHGVRLSRLARDDVRSAHEWYESIRPGLGDGLLVQLEAVLARLSRHPEIAPRYHGDARRVPYAVYYEVGDGTIDVIGVRPFAGDPAQLLTRLPD